MTLCGFAYGMKGFFIGLAGSVLGGAFVFVVLRFLFSKRLQKWSATNDKWTALETVAVSIRSGFVRVKVFTRALGSSESQRPSVGHSDSGVFHATLGVFQYALRRESSIRSSPLRPLVDRNPRSQLTPSRFGSSSLRRSASLPSYSFTPSSGLASPPFRMVTSERGWIPRQRSLTAA